MYAYADMPLAAEARRVAGKKESAIVESYEDWRDRMLKKAYAELAQLETVAKTES